MPYCVVDHMSAFSLEDEASGKLNVILTSFNRNFRGRNDGFKSTLAFIGSPELVVAKILAGSLAFNPVTDMVPGPDGQAVKLDPPEVPELPERQKAAMRANLKLPRRSES